MLISMPTGTSTIFGDFQAILALLANGEDVHPPSIKPQREKKFASEIFSSGPLCGLLQCKKPAAGLRIKPDWDQWFRQGLRHRGNTIDVSGWAQRHSE
jgi:hypothetical protein